MSMLFFCLSLNINVKWLAKQEDCNYYDKNKYTQFLTMQNDDVPGKFRLSNQCPAYLYVKYAVYSRPIDLLKISKIGFFKL